MNTVHHDQHQTVEIEQPTIIQKNFHRKEPTIQEKINEMPKTVEQIVPVEKIADVHVVKQFQALQVQAAQKLFEVPEIQYIGRTQDVLVVKHVEVEQIQKVPKTVESCCCHSYHQAR